MSTLRELNLLPRSRRAHLQRQGIVAGTKGLALTIFGGALFLTLAGTGILGWAWWATNNTEVRALSDDIRAYEQLRAGVESYNDQLRQLAVLEQERVVWSRLLQDLFRAVPAGVTIDKMSVNAETRIISLSGVAVTRAALIVLERQLNDLTWAEAINAPQKNLLQRTNSLFEFSLKVSKV